MFTRNEMRYMLNGFCSWRLCCEGCQLNHVCKGNHFNQLSDEALLRLFLNLIAYKARTTDKVILDRYVNVITDEWLNKFKEDNYE